MKGMGNSNSGLTMFNYRRLRMQSVDVTDFENIGIDVSNNDGTFPVLHTHIVGCTFKDNKTALGIGLMKQAYVINSSFEGSTETDE